MDVGSLSVVVSIVDKWDEVDPLTRVGNGYVCVIKMVELCGRGNDVIGRIYLHPGVIKMRNYVTSCYSGKGNILV